MEDMSMVELPAPIQFEVGGHTVTVTYEQSWGIMARVSLPPALLRQIDGVVEGVFKLVDLPLPTWRYTWRVVGEADKELVSSPVWGGLQFLYDEYVKNERREQNYDTLSADLILLMERKESLEKRGMPVAELATALQVASETIDSLFGYWRKTTFAEAQSALTRVRRLIAEIEGPLITVVVRGLMSGDIYHRDIYNNRRLRGRQQALWIRIGGDAPLREHFGDTLDLLTDDRLAAIYAERLAAAGIESLTDVANTDLALDPEVYVPEWLLEVPELEPAPANITIETSGKTVVAPVTYSLRDDNGELVPTGTVQMTLNEYRAARSIPSLPHGIELVFVLTVNRIEVVRGPVGPVLAKRVKAYKGGQRRSAAVPAGELYRSSPIAAGETPPWGPSRVRWR